MLAGLIKKWYKYWWTGRRRRTMEKLRFFIDVAAHGTIFQQRKIVYIVYLTVIVAILSLAACSPQPNEINTKLGEEFSLMPGQSASIIGEPLAIRFLEVVNDSRCPTGVTCIWEGEVTCLVEITYEDSQNRMTLTQPGSGQGRADFEEYGIDFQVQPYPEAGKQIAKQDYRLQLVIDKKAALNGGILKTTSWF
jgi:hypothetical protein